MFIGAFFHPFVHIQLIIQLLSHSRRVNVDFECHMVTMTTNGVSIEQDLAHKTYLISRANHTVELAPNPSFPTT